MNNKNGYSTWDPRKLNGGDGGAHGVQYDEIPYGDGGPNLAQSGKGHLPEVPVEYSQVPQIPQRQGERRSIFCIAKQLQSTFPFCRYTSYSFLNMLMFMIV